MKTWRRAYIGTGPACKVTRRVDAGATTEGWNGRPDVPCLVCVKLVHVPMKPITGWTSDHICDARCLGATGPTCECSCGGANHGKSFS